jgi:hypothetical protein
MSESIETWRELEIHTGISHGNLTDALSRTDISFSMRGTTARLTATLFKLELT